MVCCRKYGFILVYCLQGSPGNLSQFEDILFDNVDRVEGSAIVAIKINISAKLMVRILRGKNRSEIDKRQEILIFGIIFSNHQLGLSVSPWLTAWSRKCLYAK